MNTLLTGKDGSEIIKNMTIINIGAKHKLED